MPSFPSDTLTAVYREAIRGDTAASAASAASSPDVESWAAERPSAAARYAPWRNDREVTNHVGEIGVMSRLAYELRERDKAMAAGRQGEEEDHDHGERGGHSHHHHHHPVRRGVTGAVSSSSSSSFERAADGRTAANRVVSSLEEYRARLRRTGARPQRTRRQDDGGRGRTPRHSGVQVELLSLYRQMLREVDRMTDPDTRKNLRTYIRAEFDKNVSVPRKHIAKIEWCMNTAKRKLEDLQRMSSTTKFYMR